MNKLITVHRGCYWQKIPKTESPKPHLVKEFYQNHARLRRFLIRCMEKDTQAILGSITTQKCIAIACANGQYFLIEPDAPHALHALPEIPQEKHRKSYLIIKKDKVEIHNLSTISAKKIAIGMLWNGKGQLPHLPNNCRLIVQEHDDYYLVKHSAPNIKPILII